MQRYNGFLDYARFCHIIMKTLESKKQEISVKCKVLSGMTRNGKEWLGTTGTYGLLVLAEYRNLSSLIKRIV